jgi:hypothetical protein
VIGGVATDYVGVTGGAAFGQPEWSLQRHGQLQPRAGQLSLQGRYIDSGIFNVNYIEVGRARLQPRKPVQRQRQHGRQRVLHHVVRPLHTAGAGGAALGAVRDDQ